MSRRKYRTPEESRKLLELISGWKIDFDSATTLDDWDARRLPSRQIFEQILEIKAVSFVSYPQEDHSNKEAALQKKLLVRKLQANTARCRRERDNEAGWVNNVANLVFESLNGFEFRCQVCDAYLWLPDFVARPADPVMAQRLLQKYRRRKICGCSASRRAAVVRVRPGSPSIFSNKSDERVFHNSTSPQKLTVDQKYKRPDRVYGLSITGSFDQFRNKLAKYSPFSGKHTLFPFMVVEAKSEKSEAGFHDIEQQSALSIRTCLKIQTDLKKKSGHVLDGLVWFFGFRGDEWRLYVALPVGERTKIIDCWHGCISKADEALQLLLIVDFICFWARDVHRKAVLKCLSSLEAGERIPAATVLTSQEERTEERNATRSSSLVFRSSRPVGQSPESNAQYKVNSPLNDAHQPEDHLMQDSFSIDSSDHEGGEGGSNAVRSAHDIVFRWKHFALPEDDINMSECLRAITSSDGVQNAARALWEFLTDENSTVKMSLKTISELLQNSTEQYATEAAAEEPAATFLACQCRLTETSWQVICTYWCITCSQSAAQLLAREAGVTSAEAFVLSHWRAHDCNCLISAVADFQGLSGKESAVAAISQDIYCIRTRTSGPIACHLEWFKSDRTTVQPRVAMLETLFTKAESAQQASLPQAMLRTSSGATLTSSKLFETADLDKVPGVILKKPESWPATCPSWCFLTFELGGRESIGRQIELALQQNAIYAAGHLNRSDQQSIEEWALATKDVMQSIDAPY